MMMVLGLITMFFITVTTIIIFFCTSVVGLAVLDYLLDSDIKGALVSLLGPRHLLKKLRIKVLQIFKKYDTASQKDLYFVTGDPVWNSPLNYDKEIEALIDKINTDYKSYSDIRLDDNVMDDSITHVVKVEPSNADPYCEITVTGKDNAE